MIKFKTVKAWNFTSVGTKPICIQLDKYATCLVQGKNGSAKSSMFLDTLSWACYGRAFRNVKKSQLVNSINKKDCMVEVDFSIGSKDYKVRRGMYPEVFEVYENDVQIKVGGGLKDLQEHLEKKILRMNHKSFCQIVTIGSATFVPFMQLSQGARREIIEDLLDLQVFSQMNRLLKHRVDSNRQEISNIRYEIDLLDEKITLQKQYIQNLKNKVKADRADIQNRINLSTSQIEEHQSKIREYESVISDLKSQTSDYDKMAKRAKQYNTVEGQLRERASKLRREIAFFDTNDHCPTCKQAIDQGFKCDTISAKATKSEEISSALEQVKVEIEKAKTRLDKIKSIQAEISEYQGMISTENSTIAGLNRYISDLQKELNAETPSAFTSDEEESKLEQYRIDREEIEKRREELLNQKRTYDVASVLLKDGGIKSKIIKQYIPVINAAINRYLAVLDLNVEFQLDENFDETIKSRYREAFSYESFSEGEKARINLAITFAWRTIAKMRNSSSTNLLILDEVADGGVDSDGIDDLVKILGTMGDTHVFVISHRESMLDKFDACIKFAKIRNFSHVVEEA